MLSLPPVFCPVRPSQWLLNSGYRLDTTTVTLTVNYLVNRVKQRPPRLVLDMMGDCISMLISDDSPSDETLNRGPWCCSCGVSIDFP